MFVGYILRFRITSFPARTSCGFRFVLDVWGMNDISSTTWLLQSYHLHTHYSTGSLHGVIADAQVINHVDSIRLNGTDLPTKRPSKPDGNRDAKTMTLQGKSLQHSLNLHLPSRRLVIITEGSFSSPLP